MAVTVYRHLMYLEKACCQSLPYLMVENNIITGELGKLSAAGAVEFVPMDCSTGFHVD